MVKRRNDEEDDSEEDGDNYEDKSQASKDDESKQCCNTNTPKPAKKIKPNKYHVTRIKIKQEEEEDQPMQDPMVAGSAQ